MKVFQESEAREAIAHAAAGGQAIHCHQIIVNPELAPACFVRAVRRGENIAHLFDMDLQRLKVTARRLGVRVIVVEHEGTPRQHVDLCGQPLRRALALAEALAQEGR